jgi:hypothetical protein
MQARAKRLYVRPKMIGCDKIQIMDAQLDQVERKAVEFLCRYSLTFSVCIGDLPVLAEDAAEVASGEKDGSGAAHSGNRRFLAVVQSGVRKQNVAGDFAEAGFSSRPVDAATARTAFAPAQLF